MEEELLKKERELARTEEDVKSTGSSHHDRDSVAETRKMLERWVALNYGRTVIPFVGVAVAWSLY